MIVSRQRHPLSNFPPFCTCPSSSSSFLQQLLATSFSAGRCNRQKCGNKRREKILEYPCHQHLYSVGPSSASTASDGFFAGLNSVGCFFSGLYSVGCFFTGLYSVGCFFTGLYSVGCFFIGDLYFVRGIIGLYIVRGIVGCLLHRRPLLRPRHHRQPLHRPRHHRRLYIVGCFLDGPYIVRGLVGRLNSVGCFFSCLYIVRSLKVKVKVNRSADDE